MVHLLSVATKYLSEIVFHEKKCFELDPTTTLAKVALFHYMPIGTKPSISDYAITYDLPSQLQPLLRKVTHASREDLTLIDTAIVKALKKYPPYKGTFHRQLFNECLKGLKTLKLTYQTSSITCMAIEKIYDYIALELDKLKEIDAEEPPQDDLYSIEHVKGLSADFDIIAQLHDEEKFESQERYCRRIIDLLADQDECYKQKLGVSNSNKDKDS